MVQVIRGCNFNLSPSFKGRSNELSHLKKKGSYHTTPSRLLNIFAILFLGLSLIVSIRLYIDDRVLAFVAFFSGSLFSFLLYSLSNILKSLNEIKTKLK